MREFSLDSFVKEMIDLMSNAFPYMEDDKLDAKKHPKRNPLHLKNAIFDTLLPVPSENGNVITFDIGNETLEATHPYYHILQDAQVIRKAGRGTTKSKGSQDKIKDLGKRDYGRISWNGKTYTKEYSRNVRGSRSLLGKAQKRAWLIDSEGVAYRIYTNTDADYYANVHYKYLDRMFDEGGIAQTLANDFGLRIKSHKNNGLQEDFLSQLTDFLQESEYEVGYSPYDEGDYEE